MSINDYNKLLVGGANSGSMENLTPAKLTDSGSKKRGFNYTIFNMNDNDLASTTDNATTGGRIESSYRANLQKNLNKLESHRENQEKKALQQIEERLEREYKFYQVKTSMNEMQEKVPEILLRDAAEQALTRLCKISTQHSAILTRVKECYNNCLKTTLSEVDSKAREIKKLKREFSKLEEKYADAHNAMTIKEHTIDDLEAEIDKLKRGKKEDDQQYAELAEY